MDTSLYLARVLGLFYILSGIAMLLNAREYRKIFSTFIKSKTSVVLVAMFVLLIGLFLVVKHNIWQFTWVGLVTLLSWLILIKGALLTLFPYLGEAFEKQTNSVTWYQVGGIVEVILGVYLVYAGFFI
jgi:hypothetical protein